jgi:alginate O-acetyltransferase complex protein AlgI
MPISLWTALNVLLVGSNSSPLILEPIHLPIGVSFFIFQGLAYVVDVQRGHVAAQHKVGPVVLYISMFPQLIAGPIVRFQDVAAQIEKRTFDFELFASGIRRFIIGLAKKLLIADLAARVADPIFALDPNVLPASVAWLGLIAYAVQIYFDFSGYSDMAIGLGRMLGFRFLENFNFPYTAASIREFWQRWHISLSTWFRDYLYIPLGGNRNGPLRTYFNLFAVFFLTGLWHGASWNFVVWGFVHGLFIVVERLGFGKVLNGLPRAVGMMYTLLVVVLAWVFFRCTDATHALHYLVALWSSGHGDPSLYYTSHYLPNDVRLALVLGVTGGLGWWSTLRSHSQKILKQYPMPAWVQELSLLFLFVLCAMALATSTYHPFIYFRF